MIQVNKTKKYNKINNNKMYAQNFNKHKSVQILTACIFINKTINKRFVSFIKQEIVKKVTNVNIVIKKSVIFIKEMDLAKKE